MGGEISNVDPVRDQLTLKIFGAHPVKILFDERTRIYRDGVRIPLHDLGPAEHAAVETVLDGTDVFALSVHILSQSPEGQCQGQVLSYNASNGTLTVSDSLSRRPVKLHITNSTTIVGVGQVKATGGTAGSLVKGTLISASFQSADDGLGNATHIEVLATPGSAFVFSGNVAALDMHADRLVLVDPRDNKSYQIYFDPSRFPESHGLREGQRATVTATFDGTRYVATTMTVN